MEAKMMQYVYTGKSPEPTGNRYLTSAPYDLYHAKDGCYVIASGTDKHFEVLSAAMGMPELAQDPRFCDTPARNKNFQALKDIMNDWGKDKEVMDIVKIIDGVGVPVAPIYNCEQAANDPAIVEDREMLVKIPAHPAHPESGDLTVIGNPVKMKESPATYNFAAPDLGEHNKEIFSALGFSDEELNKMIEEGVIC
jgi:formyl-CoA transferase